MEYRLLATDMDGTLLNNHKAISIDNLRALMAALSIGTEIVICTGRCYGSLDTYLKQLGFPCWLVTNNGAIIRNKKGEVIRAINLSQTAAEAVLVALTEEGVYYHGTDADQNLVNSYWEQLKIYKGFLRKRVSSDLRSWLYAIREVLLKNTHRRVNLMEYLKKGGKLASIFVYDPDTEKLNKLKKRLESITDVQITSSGNNNIEILHPLATKGFALEKVAGEMGILPEEIIAVGDHLNDLSMIEFAGLGVAMANAETEVLTAANWVTKSNDEDGIKHLIEKMIMNKTERDKNTCF